ncbi:hypothetical protein COOONC_01735 [Cooperia oncophora]
MKAFHGENLKMHHANEAKIEKIDLKMSLLNARIDQMDKDFRNEIKQLRDHLSPMNTTQLSLDVKGLCEQFEELKLRLSSIDVARITTRTEQPSHDDTARTTASMEQPRSELDRIRRQLVETEKELQTIRNETHEVNALIEKERQRDRSTAALDDLKVKATPPPVKGVETRTGNGRPRETTRKGKHRSSARSSLRGNMQEKRKDESINIRKMTTIAEDEMDVNPDIDEARLLHAITVAIKRW